MKTKMTIVVVSLTLAVMAAPFAAAHLTAKNLNDNPATLDGTGDPCRNQDLLAGPDATLGTADDLCEISTSLSGTYTAAGNFLTADMFPIFTPRPSTIAPDVFPTDPVGPVGPVGPLGPFTVPAQDPRVGLCVGFDDSNPRSDSSDGEYCTAPSGGFCDSEWIDTDTFRESIVEGDSDNSQYPGSSGSMADGVFDDGGEGNAVCNADNAGPLGHEWNRFGCSDNLNAEDASGGENWLGSFCDSVTVVGSFSFDDCVINQAILGGESGVVGVIGGSATPEDVRDQVNYCVTTQLSTLGADPGAPTLACAGKGFRDGQDTAIFGAGSTAGGIGLPPALAPTTGTCSNGDQLLQAALVYNMVDAGSDNGGSSVFVGGSHGWVDGQ